MNSILLSYSWYHIQWGICFHHISAGSAFLSIIDSYIIIFLLYFIINCYYINIKFVSLQTHAYCDVISLMSLGLSPIVFICLRL